MILEIEQVNGADPAEYRGRNPRQRRQFVKRTALQIPHETEVVQFAIAKKVGIAVGKVNLFDFVHDKSPFLFDDTKPYYTHFWAHPQEKRPDLRKLQQKTLFADLRRKAILTNRKRLVKWNRQTSGRMKDLCDFISQNNTGRETSMKAIQSIKRKARARLGQQARRIYPAFAVYLILDVVLILAVRMVLQQFLQQFSNPVSAVLYQLALLPSDALLFWIFSGLLCALCADDFRISAALSVFTQKQAAHRTLIAFLVAGLPSIVLTLLAQLISQQANSSSFENWQPSISGSVLGTVLALLFAAAGLLLDMWKAVCLIRLHSGETSLRRILSDFWNDLFNYCCFWLSFLGWWLLGTGAGLLLQMVAYLFWPEQQSVQVLLAALSRILVGLGFWLVPYFFTALTDYVHSGPAGD